MTRYLMLAFVAMALAGCSGQGREPVAISVTPLPARVPTECRVKAKPFIKIREAGKYGPGDLARDWRRGKQRYRREAARADRCRKWVSRIHQPRRKYND
jgi:hypothetical protein